MWPRSINKDNRPCTWQGCTEHSSTRGLGVMYRRALPSTSGSRMGDGTVHYHRNSKPPQLWWGIRHSTVTDSGLYD